MACTDYVGSIMEHLLQSEVRSALLSSFGASGIEQRLAGFAPPSRSAHMMVLHWYVCSRDDFRRSYRLAIPAGCDINAGLQHAAGLGKWHGQLIRYLQMMLAVVDRQQHDRQRCAIDIMLHIAVQRRRRPMASYMSIVQSDMHAGMRAILVDWLVEVSLVSHRSPRSPPAITCNRTSL